MGREINEKNNNKYISKRSYFWSSFNWMYSTSSSNAGAEVVIQASVVDKVQATGLTISAAEGNNCYNDIEVQASSEKFNLTKENMQGVDGTECTIIEKDFEIEVNTSKAYSGDEKLSDKLGSAPLKGYKGKKVNVFSTIQVENGVAAADLVEIDVEVEDVEGLKDL